MKNKDLIREVAKMADKQLDFKKVFPGLGGLIVEFIDGKIFEVALEYLLTILPEKFHDEFELILEAYVTGDFSRLELESVEKLNQAIDLPGLDEVEEAIVLKSIIGGFFSIIKHRKSKDSQSNQ